MARPGEHQEAEHQEAEHSSEFASKKKASETSLVVQWLICLPTQGSQVWSLVQEDPICSKATKPLSHSYWAHILEPVTTTTEPTGHNYWSPPTLKLMLHNRRSHHVEKLLLESGPHLPQLEKAQQWRPSAAKNKLRKKKVGNCPNGWMDKQIVTYTYKWYYSTIKRNFKNRYTLQCGWM